MGKQVVKWTADDGKEFDSKEAMLRYELGLLDAKEIDLWLDKTLPATSRRKSEYRKLLINWQGHMNSIEEDLLTKEEVSET